MKLCLCGNEVWNKKHGKCRRCYYREYMKTWTPPYPPEWKPTALTMRPAGPRHPATPCSYQVAHNNVAQWRGKASTHTCRCGQPATEWAYRKGDTWEQTGEWHGYTVSYSLNIWAYDPLCYRCHKVRDHGEQPTYPHRRSPTHRMNREIKVRSWL